MFGKKDIEILVKYFPELTQYQLEEFINFGTLLFEWNKKINVISRKDIDYLFEHHILHALALTKFVKFKPEVSVLDIGTGGGLPGIPLAIYFPKVKFHLIDSRNKKVIVVSDIIKKLSINNVIVTQEHSEHIKEKFDVIIGRAIMDIEKFITSTRKNLKKNKNLPHQIYYWKGGEIVPTIKKYNYSVYKLDKIFKEDYFLGKHILGIKF